MKFEEKYISATEKGLEKDSKKKVLSDDAYALGEAINDLIIKIEHTRLSLMK